MPLCRDSFPDDKYKINSLITPTLIENPGPFYDIYAVANVIVFGPSFITINWKYFEL
jgi:hypothetical protein